MKELCGALPLIINHLDPRPQASPGGGAEDLDHYGHGTEKDPDVLWLARLTYKKAIPSGGDDSSLRPTANFISRAELAEAAGLALLTLSVETWGIKKLLGSSAFMRVSGDLWTEELLPQGLVTVLGALFSCTPWLMIILPSSSLLVKFLRYVTKCITGAVNTPRHTSFCGGY